MSDQTQEQTNSNPTNQVEFAAEEPRRDNDVNRYITVLLVTALITGGLAGLGVLWWQNNTDQRQQNELLQFQNQLQHLYLNPGPSSQK